jgi:predicted membrane protein
LNGRATSNERVRDALIQLAFAIAIGIILVPVILGAIGVGFDILAHVFRNWWKYLLAFFILAAGVEFWDVIKWPLGYVFLFVVLPAGLVANTINNKRQKKRRADLVAASTIKTETDTVYTWRGNEIAGEKQVEKTYYVFPNGELCRVEDMKELELFEERFKELMGPPQQEKKKVNREYYDPS